MSVTRRDILFRGAALLASLVPRDVFAACSSPCRPLIGSATAREFFSLIESTPVVDAHGHIFNASDLPVLEWLHEVEIANKIDELGLGLAQEWADGAARAVIKGNLQRELGHLRLAPTAQTEKSLIQLLLTDRALRSQVILNGQPTRNFHRRIIRVAINNESDINKDFLRTACLSITPAIDYGRIERGDKKSINILESRYATLMSGLKATRTCPSEGMPALVESLRAFSAPLARSRLENLLDWQRTYRVVVANQQGVRPLTVFTPAIVDVDYWLRYERQGQSTHRSEPLYNQRSSVPDQVDVLSGISQMYPATLAPFVGFDPWRQAVEGTALDVVEDAVLNKGFVGVKIYPAIGFRPISNKDFDKLPDSDGPFPIYAQREGLGKRLDEALLQLYRFCMQHDVPIMAHCANSKGSFQTKVNGELAWVSERSHPKYWKRLLDGRFGSGAAGEFKSLRLNLAHLAFGAPDWSDAIGSLLDDYPNVYGDASFFAEALGSSDQSSACGRASDLADRARRFLRETSGRDSVRFRKVMYGSDWFMTTTEAGYDSYLNIMSRLYFDRVVGSSSAADSATRSQLTRDFISGNALRFLGLDQRDRKSFNRLSRFFSTSTQLNRSEKAAAARALDRLILQA